MSALSLFVAAASALFGAYRQLQMLQQNSYFPSRYGKWLRQNFWKTMVGEGVLFFFAAVFFAFDLWILGLVLWAAVLGTRVPTALWAHQSAIKPLVFTARVKRLYACFAAMMLIPAAVCLFFKGTLPLVLGLAALLFATVLPVGVLAAWGLTAPVEKAVAQYFVNDAKKKLADFSNLNVIGVTGSYGKTTTKFILERLLREKFNVVATPQSFNTPMGVVRTVREKLTASTQVFICEMGAKNVGDIREICDIVHPDFGLITSVGAQHLETFKTVDNVFATKFELADAVQKKGGVTFVNGSSEELKNRLTAERGCVVYGLEEGLDFYAENVRYSRGGSSFTLVLKGERVEVTTKLLGLHSVTNIVAAAAVAYTLGVSARDIQYAVASLKPTEHRLELKPFRNHALLIDDAYNANPEGSIEAVRVLGSFEGMKKYIVTPGLIELGEREYECNYALGLAAAQHCDRIILVGKNRSKPLREAVESTAFDLEKLTVVSSFQEAMDEILPEIGEDCVVLLENDLPDNYLN